MCGLSVPDPFLPASVPNPSKGTLMNKKGIILVIILIVGIAAIVMTMKDRTGPARSAAIGLDAPSFELKDTEGRVWKLTDLKGKAVLVNFWATWCDSCKSEKPSQVNLVNAKKGNDSFVYLTVLYRDDPAKVAGYLRDNGYRFPVLIDDRNVAAQYGVTGVPETFLIDKRGVLREKFIGPVMWDSPEAMSAVSRIIEERV